MSNLDEIRSIVDKGMSEGTYYKVKCPCHDDNNPSFALRITAGNLEGKCYAGCPQEEVNKVLSQVKAVEDTVVYEYKDESGKCLYRKVRKPNKQFHIEGDSKTRRILYNSHRLPTWEGPVLVVEGEKDADICIEHGFLAVCNFDGAGKWRQEYTEQLRQRDVVIVPDYDEPGYKHAQLVKKYLKEACASVTVLNIKELFEDIGTQSLWKGADIYDWFQKGGSADKLREIACLGSVNVPDISVDVREYLAKVEHEVAVGVQPGLPTGFTELDELIGGLYPGLTILAARPSVGKTALATNIIEHNLQSGGVAFFSLEMSKDEIITRMCSSIGDLDSNLIRDRSLSEGDLRVLEESAAQVAASSLMLDDTPSLPIRQLRNKAHNFSQKHKLKLIVVDYIQIMRGNKYESDRREREIAEITGGLKALSKELGCPVLALSQLNRAVESRGSGRPILSDLRDSGAIEQDADVIAFLWKHADESYTSLTVGKNRNGACGEIKLCFDAPKTRFTSHSDFTTRAEPNISDIIADDLI